jgi:hypothetical protein
MPTKEVAPKRPIPMVTLAPSALAVLSALLAGGLALAGVGQLVGAVGDLGRVRGHRGDIESGGFDRFGGSSHGRPAGGVSAGGGALGDVAGHVHFEVEAWGGGAAVEVNLAGADGHGHCLGSMLVYMFLSVCCIGLKFYRSISAAEFCESVARSRYALQSEDSGAGAGVYNGSSVGESAC